LGHQKISWPVDSFFARKYHHPISKYGLVVVVVAMVVLLLLLPPLLPYFFSFLLVFF
jgi:hypothetical protein